MAKWSAESLGSFFIVIYWFVYRGQSVYHLLRHRCKLFVGRRGVDFLVLHRLSLWRRTLNIWGRFKAGWATWIVRTVSQAIGCQLTAKRDLWVIDIRASNFFACTERHRVIIVLRLADWIEISRRVRDLWRGALAKIVIHGRQGTLPACMIWQTLFLSHFSLF